MLIRSSAAIAAVILLSSPALAEGIKLTDPQIAQPDAFKRTTLQTIDFPPGYETEMVIAELAPGSCTGRHSHPGIESAYVLEGEAVAKFDSKPKPDDRCNSRPEKCITCVMSEADGSRL
jgi:hypothetical protein